MAILLGGFLLLGLVPGPDMLTKHLAVTFSMVWTIVLANVIAVAVCFLFLNRLAALTTVRGHLLIPVILVLVFIGSYTANNHYGDIIVTLMFGGIGYLMVVGGWPRAPFVLGLVLGKIAENYLYISVARYEAAWLSRPVVLMLFALAVAVILYPFIQIAGAGACIAKHRSLSGSASWRCPGMGDLSVVLAVEGRALSPGDRHPAVLPRRRRSAVGADRAGARR